MSQALMGYAALKHRLFRGFSRLSAATGTGSKPGGLRVLLYHAVGSNLSADPYGISLPVAAFKDQMSLLASQREAWEPVLFGRPNPKRQLAITFDDGYKDTLRTAAPILLDLGLPFTVFITASFVRKPSELHLNPQELKELAALPGVLIGAHGASHRPLTALEDGTLRQELAESRKYLEDILGRPITSLSYPHGKADKRVRDAAAEAGFVLGGCSRYGLNGPRRDLLLLCRTEITAWDGLEELELKVNGHWDWFRFRHKDPAATAK